MKKISTAKAAKILGVSRWTLRRWGDKKLIAFTTSKSGYRYYTEEDLNSLKEHHAIVHVKTKKQKIVIVKRDETLLLPSPPTPHSGVSGTLSVSPPHSGVSGTLSVSKPESVHPIVTSPPIVPPPEPPPPSPIIAPADLVSEPSVSPNGDSGTLTAPVPPKKKSAFSRFWKILPFTVFILVLVRIYLPLGEKKPIATPQMLLGFPAETQAGILPAFTFREVVSAAATDSSDLTSSSVRFFLADGTDEVGSMLSPDGNTPQPGNSIYLSNMTSFASFQESPFAYLNGSHGPAGPVAIIDNEETLRTHPFFANVKNGDKLLIYQESGKAVLLRPLTNEVIAFAPLDAVPATSYPSLNGQPVVALRNGMGTPYDMKTFEAELTFVSPTSVVVDNANAGKSDYKKSIIVDVTGTKKAAAQELAYKLRLTLSDLPEGEYRPPAGVDFLVILGKDRVPLMNYIAPSSTASATPAPKQP